MRGLAQDPKLSEDHHKLEHVELPRAPKTSTSTRKHLKEKPIVEDYKVKLERLNPEAKKLANSLLLDLA
jgi:hypothetical protein